MTNQRSIWTLVLPLIASLVVLPACDDEDEEGSTGDTMNTSETATSGSSETADTADSAASDSDASDSDSSSMGCEGETGETGEDTCPDYTSCVAENCEDCLDVCADYISCATGCACDDMACQAECLGGQSADCSSCFLTQGMCAGTNCAAELQACAG